MTARGIASSAWESSESCGAARVLDRRECRSRPGVTWCSREQWHANGTRRWATQLARALLVRVRVSEHFDGELGTR